MTPRLTISHAGLELIKAHEGIRRTAAELPDGGWVIGYSHIAADGHGVRVDEERAEKLLVEDVEPIGEAINDWVLAPLSQNQFDALASLAFNIGLEQFRKSGIVRCLNEGRPIDAAQGFDIWRKAVIEGEVYVVDALVRRRAAEKALFLSPEAGPVAAPTAEAAPIADPGAVHGAPLETPIAVDFDFNGRRAIARHAERAREDAAAAATQIVARLNRILPEASDPPVTDRAIATETAPSVARETVEFDVIPASGEPSEDEHAADAPPAHPLQRRAGLSPALDDDDPFDDLEDLLAGRDVERGRRNGADGRGWHWLMGIVSVAVIIGSSFEISRAVGENSGAALPVGWTIGALAGGLGLVVSVYLAVRRLSDFDDD